MNPQSHRGDLTARMVELLLLLTDGSRSQRELIKHFGVDRKTIKRAIDALSLHYQIVEEPDGREIRYRFSDDYKFVPPTLTPSELATLLLAQESIAATGLSAFGSPFAEHARRLLMKVRISLPAPLQAKLDALASVFGSAAVAAKDFAPHAATVDRLTNAAMEQRQVRLRYHSLTDDKIKERLIDPYSVYFDPDGATLKLIAYDYLRHDIIPFSIDHIKTLHDTDTHFTRPPDFNLHHYLTERCFNGIHGEPITVRLRAHNMTARIFRERVFHPSQHVVEDTPNTVTIEMRVARGRGLVRFILSWSPDIEVIKPEELLCEIADLHRQSLARMVDVAK
ncbi:MAG: WYL domain-containing protein [Pyrinomonadaceae bacterium MAG19_C2-C3]|nr:WYL domain-containing protein [Pyrinomonadaceae bacterium MAG19_C2-C3]